jgi:hypothetical protein
MCYFLYPFNFQANSSRQQNSLRLAKKGSLALATTKNSSNRFVDSNIKGKNNEPNLLQKKKKVYYETGTYF